MPRRIPHLTIGFVIVSLSRLALCSEAQTGTRSGTVGEGHQPCDLPARFDFARAQEWYLPTADKAATLYLYEFGTGMPVVVIHGGFGAEHSYLLDAVSGLDDDGHFIFYDQRGSLRSPCDNSVVSIEKHVEDLETLRKELGLPRMKLLAHSMGTLIAMFYAAKYPEHVDGLILTGAITAVGDTQTLGQPEPEAKRWFDRPEVQAEIEKVSAHATTQTERQKTNIWRIEFAAANIYHVSRWREMKGGRVFYNQSVGDAAATSLPQNWDFTSVLKSCSYPLTFIEGDHDFADFENKFYRRFCLAVPNAKLSVLKNAGHNGWIDQPEAFRRALRAALGKANEKANP